MPVSVMSRPSNEASSVSLRNAEARKPVAAKANTENATRVRVRRTGRTSDLTAAKTMTSSASVRSIQRSNSTACCNCTALPNSQPSIAGKTKRAANAVCVGLDCMRAW